GEAMVDACGAPDGLAAEGDDQVAGLEPAARGRTPRRDVRDQRTAWPAEAETLGDFVRHLLQLGAEPRPFDRAAAALRGSDDHAHHVGRNRKADALRTARPGEDGGVDAGQPSAEID